MKYLISHNTLQVLFDFDLMFEHIDGGNLISKWQSIKEIPYSIYDIYIDDKKHPIVKKSDDVHDFLTYFKLIPTHRVPFDVAVNFFIVYTDVRIHFIFALSTFSNEIFFSMQDPNKDPVEMILSNNSHPHLIVIASQEANKMKHYIVLENRIMSVRFKQTSFCYSRSFCVSISKQFSNLSVFVFSCRWNSHSYKLWTFSLNHTNYSV